MVTLPAALGFQWASLEKDVAIAEPRATVSFSWRVESLNDAPDVSVADIRTTSPNLTRGVGLTFAGGKARFCDAAPVDIAPGTWHKAEATVVSGALSCAMDGTTAVVSTNGPASIVGVRLGPQRSTGGPLIDAAVPPAVKVFFDNVLVKGP